MGRFGSEEHMYERGDASHIALYDYHVGEIKDLDEWTLRSLAAITHPQTAFRYEIGTHVDVVNSEWVDKSSIVIWGPDDNHQSFDRQSIIEG